MRSLIITIKGKVQKIGLRHSVFELAKKMELKGEVQNMGSDQIMITLQGHDLKAEAFIAHLKKSNTRLQIENFEVTEKDLPSFTTFSIIEN